MRKCIRCNQDMIENLEINVSNDDYEVSGYISMPEINRSSRNHMTVLVNGRVVRNQVLNKIIGKIKCAVCPECGYLETYIDDTTKLKNISNQE